MLQLKRQILLNVALLGVLLVQKRVMTLFNLLHPLANLFAIFLIVRVIHFISLQVYELLLVILKLFRH